MPTLIQKRRVQMQTAVMTDLGPQIHEAVDFVPVADLDTYLADAATRWQRIVVGTDHDAGPGGDTYTEE